MKDWLKTFLWAFCSILFLALDIEGQLLSPELGTIIVNYQTDQGGQRLDRIRFWLINDQNERTLYPKKDEFVSNSHAPNERTVVITHLQPGNYRIEFLLPNTDQFFELVPSRQVNLNPGEVQKVDQTIHLRPISFHAPPNRNGIHIVLAVDDQSSPFLSGGLAPPPFPLPGPYTSFPATAQSATFSLASNQHAKWKLVLQGQVVYTYVGSISNISIPPGRRYSIVAEDLPGYSFYTKPKVPFDIGPGQNIRVELLYQRDIGFMRLQGNVPAQVESLSFILYSDDPKQPPIRKELISKNGKISWESDSLPTGVYTLSYTIPNLSTPIENQRFLIKKGERQIVNMPYFSQNGSLEIISDSPQALFTLLTPAGAIIGRGKGYHYTFKDLDAGLYVVKFSNADPHLSPNHASEQVKVENDQQVQLHVKYLKSEKLKEKNIQRQQDTLKKETIKKKPQPFFPPFKPTYI